MGYFLRFLPDIIGLVKSSFSKGSVANVAGAVVNEVVSDTTTTEQAEVENAKSKWHQIAVCLSVFYLVSIGWIGLYCGLKGGALFENYNHLMATEEFRDLNFGVMIFIGGMGISSIFKRKRK